MNCPVCSRSHGHNDTTMDQFIRFQQWQEDQAKKAKDESEKSKKKPPFWGLSHREVFFYTFVPSIFYGPLLAIGAIKVFKAMWITLGTL